MSQYFENDKSLDNQPSIVSFELNHKTYELHSNLGVFSKDKLDTGTRILLETVLKEQEEPSTTLDMGCGIGPVGIVLMDHWKTEMTMIDVNERAASLAKQNVEDYHMKANVLCQDGVTSGQYECIVFNPPIRTGKKVMYRLFDQCLEHLSGNLWIVMRKQHGAASAMKYFEEKGYEAQRVSRDKGFWIIKVNQ